MNQIPTEKRSIPTIIVSKEEIVRIHDRIRHKLHKYVDLVGYSPEIVVLDKKSCLLIIAACKDTEIKGKYEVLDPNYSPSNFLIPVRKSKFMGMKVYPDYSATKEIIVFGG